MGKKNKPAAVPCSMCGKDIAYFLPKADMGMCDTCKKLYCTYCLKNIKRNKCPTCNNKLAITKRVKQYPPGYGPQPMVQQSGQPVIVVQNSSLEGKIVCRKCGTINVQGAQFCNGCGREF
jgi:uncharacterized protein YbaR (Trm112 family)